MAGNSATFTITIGNAQTDSVALVKATGELLKKLQNGEELRRSDWVDVATGAAKVIADVGDLAKADTRLAAFLGPAATYVDVANKARDILEVLQTPGVSESNIKVADVLGVVGGVLDISGNFRLKSTAFLPIGAGLKLTALTAGVAQLAVGDRTLGDFGVGQKPVWPTHHRGQPANRQRHCAGLERRWRDYRDQESHRQWGAV